MKMGGIRNTKMLRVVLFVGCGLFALYVFHSYRQARNEASSKAQYLSIAEDEYQQLTKRFNMLSEELKNTVQKGATLQKQFDDERKSHLKTKQERDGIQDKCKKDEVRLNEERASLERDFRHLSEQKDQFKKDRDSLAGQLQTYTEECNEVRETAATEKKQIQADCNVKVDKCNGNVKGLEKELANVRIELLDAEQRRDLYHSELTETQQSSERNQARVATLERQNSNLGSEIDQLHSQLQKLEAEKNGIVQKMHNAQDDKQLPPPGGQDSHSISRRSPDYHAHVINREDEEVIGEDKKRAIYGNLRDKVLKREYLTVEEQKIYSLLAKQFGNERAIERGIGGDDGYRHVPPSKQSQDRWSIDKRESVRNQVMSIDAHHLPDFPGALDHGAELRRPQRPPPVPQPGMELGQKLSRGNVDDRKEVPLEEHEEIIDLVVNPPQQKNREFEHIGEKDRAIVEEGGRDREEIGAGGEDQEGGAGGNDVPPDRRQIEDDYPRDGDEDSFRDEGHELSRERVGADNDNPLPKPVPVPRDNAENNGNPIPIPRPDANRDPIPRPHADGDPIPIPGAVARDREEEDNEMAREGARVLEEKVRGGGGPEDDDDDDDEKYADFQNQEVDDGRRMYLQDKQMYNEERQKLHRRHVEQEMIEAIDGREEQRRVIEEKLPKAPVKHELPDFRRAREMR